MDSYLAVERTGMLIRATGTFIHCSWEAEMVQPFWDTGSVYSIQVSASPATTAVCREFISWSACARMLKKTCAGMFMAAVFTVVVN